MINDEKSRTPLILVALIAFLSTGCALSHVRFTREGGNPPFTRAENSYPEDGFASETDPHLFRVCIDGQGDLYPDPREIELVDDRLARGGHSVRAYYDEVLGAPYDGGRIAEGFSRALLPELRNRTLIILIHGMGNTYGTARRSYKLARLQMQVRFGDRPLSFLEVYWDGTVGDPAPMWGQAQSTSLRAGLGLRRVLNRLDDRTRIRVITHSRGAAVIASALWNFTMPPKCSSVKRYRKLQSSLPTPDHLDVRVGMLVPALGADAFDEYFERTPGRGRPAIHDRIILGVNEDDPAIGKGLLPSWMFGSTELGCNRDLFGSVVKPILKKAAFLVDFSLSGVHEFQDYLLRRAFEENFLNRLLEDARFVASN